MKITSTASRPSHKSHSLYSRPSRGCNHNNWDNVRAASRMVTLRCRVCQKQKRVISFVGWKCRAFMSAEGCGESACSKYHVNYKKQCLEERVKNHGVAVMHKVRVEHVRSTNNSYDTETDCTRGLDGSYSGSECCPSSPQETGSTCSSEQSLSSTRETTAQYCNNPYSWTTSLIYV